MSNSTSTSRRHFLLGAIVAGLGALIKLVPIVSGLTVFLNPLRRSSGRRGFVPVASLEGLPADGTPRKFPVITDRRNAWTTTPRVSIGAVYLRRLQDQSVQAFNAVCPHAGCLVGYQPEARAFQCPCHDSSFALDGTIKDARSPSPRNLDALAVRIAANGQILVQFQSFRAGIAKKIPLA